MHSKTILLSLGLMATVATADEIVTMFVADGASTQPLVGQVIGGRLDTTSYSITCADTVTSCDLEAGGATLVQGPSTHEIRASIDNEPYTRACEVGTAVATCSIKIGDEDWSDAFTDTASELPVTITSGSGVPISTPGPATSTSVSTTTETDSESDSTTPTPTPTPSSDEAGESEEAEETDSDNAAMAQVTGMAWAVAAGMAAAVAIA
ncbi:hypothetical protein BJX66DRAFT_345309 [Aspergillus keveii]|uniref:GPI anchored protein n=1 Tax=Aspergillus keveii TaxID=714993 RepID=A0ABR4FIH1_9EURO